MYLSCVAGRAFSRFGTGTAIGCEFSPGEGYRFDERVIVSLSVDEVMRYGAEYRRGVRRGDLRERTREEFEAYTASQFPPAENPADAPNAAASAATTTPPEE